jgi:hypothetical protein
MFRKPMGRTGIAFRSTILGLGVNFWPNPNVFCISNDWVAGTHSTQGSHVVVEMHAVNLIPQPRIMQVIPFGA